jgi:hypothetical protein
MLRNKPALCDWSYGACGRMSFDFKAYLARFIAFQGFLSVLCSALAPSFIYHR